MKEDPKKDDVLNKSTTGPENVETNEEVNTPPLDIEACKVKANRVIEKYSKWSLAAGLIPAPAVDLVALTAVQLKMVSEICQAFEQSFSGHKLKAILVPLVGAAMPQALTTGGVSSTLKAIPIYGTVVGMATMPLLSAGASYAIGTAFVSHFANGGTLFNLDFNSMKTAVKENVEKFKTKNTEEAAQTEDVVKA